MKAVLKTYVRVMMFLLPIMFLPVMVEPFGLGKVWLMLGSAMIGLVIWLVTMLMSKDEGFKMNSLGWWVLGLVGWSLISLIRMNPGLRMNAFTSYFGAGTMLTLGIWTFLWMQTEDEREGEVQTNFLTVAGLLVAAISLVVFLIPNSKLPLVWPKNNPTLNITSGWSLTGSIFTEILVLTFLALEWLKRLLKKIKGQDYVKEAVVMAVLMLVLFLDIYRMSKMGWAIMDNNSSWVVAVESFKTNPVFGTGIGQFSKAFNLWRPASYNLTKYWSSGFKLSGSTTLQVWTELGLVGLFVLLMMVIAVAKQKKTSFEFWRVMAYLLLVLFTPFDAIGWLLLAWLMAGKIQEKKKIDLKLKFGDNGFNAAPYAAGLVILVIVGFTSYWWIKVLTGEIFMRQSLLAASKNNGGDTYNLQIKAIGANPYSAEYRRLYSQTNLALALTMLQDKNITEDNKQKAAALVQQAVREAKSAVSLNEQDAYYWSNLALVYRQLIGLVDGTADWSYQAYTQAVALDPANVLTKLDLGGLLYAAGRYDEADRVFEQVVVNKQDFANGWYNWAYSAKQLGKLGDAVNRLTQAVTLVPADSGDYDKASKELETMKKEYDAAVKQQQAQQAQQQPKQAETLKTPEPLPTGKGTVKVPETDLAPPAVDGGNEASQSGTQGGP